MRKIQRTRVALYCNFFPRLSSAPPKAVPFALESNCKLHLARILENKVARTTSILTRGKHLSDIAAECHKLEKKGAENVVSVRVNVTFERIVPSRSRRNEKSSGKITRAKNLFTYLERYLWISRNFDNDCRKISWRWSENLQDVRNGTWPTSV